MSSQGINFNTFANKVDQKLNAIKMSEDQKSYVHSQLNSIFTQGDANNDKTLTRTELRSVLGMLNTVVDLAQNGLKPDTPQKPQEIKNPYFKGLEDYQFKQHNAKKEAGTITVNGEKMLITTDGKEYSLYRFNDGKQVSDDITKFNYTREELKNLLQDKNSNFGTYSGLENIQDVFIP